MTDDKILDRAKWLVALIILTMFAMLLGTALATWSNYRQTRDLAELLDRVEEPVADDWVLEALFGETRAGADPMLFAGNFDCSGAVIDADAPIQFTSTIRGNIAEGATSLPRLRQNPIPATEICDLGRLEFPVEWEGVVGWRRITQPTEYWLVIEASAPGFATSTAQTGPFLILPQGG